VEVSKEGMIEMYGYGMMGPIFGITTGWMLLIVVVIGVVVAFLVSYMRPGDTRDTSAAARQILAERFARGEMDTDEYVRRLAALR
jgi:putative membrane protein